MKTTSLELSKELRDAGALQKSDYHWAQWEEEEPSIECGWKGDESQVVASSFDCHELLERLPRFVEDSTLNLAPVGNDGWSAFYPQVIMGFGRADSPAEALGKLYLFCLKNGYCEGEK